MNEMEKICFQTRNNQASKQINGSKTEATLILCGYSGERANNRGDSTTERRMRRRKMRKFASRQAKNNQTDGSKTEATLILYGYSGERANRGDSTIKEEVRRRKIRKFASRQGTQNNQANKQTVQRLRPL